MRNDASSGHQALHVENGIADFGTFMSLMQPQDLARDHEFGPTLQECTAEGVHVDCGEDWTREQIYAAIKKGPHQSARTPEAIQLFKEDIDYQVKAGFARIVDWNTIKDNPLAQLKVSPVAAVPQTNRCPGSRDGAAGGQRLDRRLCTQIGTAIPWDHHTKNYKFHGARALFISDLLEQIRRVGWILAHGGGPRFRMELRVRVATGRRAANKASSFQCPSDGMEGVTSVLLLCV